jgi:hypothetical protein
MRLVAPKSFPDVLKIFDQENTVKDKQCRCGKDRWPRHRFAEANSQFGEWTEVELSHAELLDVKLFGNAAFGIPKEGMTVGEALRLDAVRAWLALGSNGVFADSHVWLASEPLRDSIAEEYRPLKNYEGRFVPLDGLHRMLAWADAGKQKTLAFIAGRVRAEILAAAEQIDAGQATTAPEVAD